MAIRGFSAVHNTRTGTYWLDRADFVFRLRPHEALEQVRAGDVLPADSALVLHFPEHFRAVEPRDAGVELGYVSAGAQ